MRSWKKMKKRLLFDWIDMYCARIAVCNGVHFAVACNPIAAESDITVIQ